MKLFFIFLCFCLSFNIQAKTITVNGFYVNLKGEKVNSKFAIHVHKGRLITDQPIPKNKRPSDEIYYSINQDFNLRIIPTQRKIQRKITLIDETGKKQIVNASQIKWFRIFIEKDSFTYYSFQYENFENYPLDPTPSIFLLLLIDGPLKLFQYNSIPYYNYLMIYNKMLYFHHYKLYSKFPKYSILHSKTHYCLKKNNDSFHNYRSIFFWLNMSEYLADDYVLSQKIKKGILGKSDIVTIVKEYNSQKNSLQ